MEFDFYIVHRPGSKQVLSDALSRREQDLPSGITDERLADRERQLLRL